MTYDILYSPRAEKTLSKWKKSNPLLAKKLGDFLKDMRQHPRTGLGKPEHLKGYPDCVFSRRLNGKDRIVYEINDEEIYILLLQLEGHYDDK